LTKEAKTMKKTLLSALASVLCFVALSSCSSPAGGENIDETGLTLTLLQTDYGKGEPLKYTLENSSGQTVPVTHDGLHYAPNTIGSQTLWYGDSNQVTVTVLTLQERIDAAAPGDTIILYGDETSSIGIPLDTEIILEGSATLTRSTYPVFGISGKLTIGTGVTIRGTVADQAPLVSVSGGTFTMKEGSTITGGNFTDATASGGAVEVVNGGTFFMEGGTITGNTAKYGGGVSVSEGSNFEMTGGSIHNNSANEGGGVYVKADSNTSFSVSEEGTIYGNTAIDTVSTQVMAGDWHRTTNIPAGETLSTNFNAGGSQSQTGDWVHN
jgi:hypothetical protein